MAPAPWTEDAILARYRFTNPWRASDRASQFLIRDVIYSGCGLPAEDVLVAYRAVPAVLTASDVAGD